MALLRLFDQDNGIQDIPIPGKRFIIGRSPEYADFCLNDPAVSRMHAMIYEAGGQFMLKDMDSTSGTFVNNKRITERKLSPGDKLLLGSTSLEFVATEEDGEDAEEFDAESTLCGISQRFKPLPSGMGMNVRILYAPPQKVFNTGDTLLIGSGGLRIPCPVEEMPSDAVLEVELLWPSGGKKIFLGEVVEVYNHRLFVMLHKPDAARYRELLETCKRGSWIAVNKLA